MNRIRMNILAACLLGSMAFAADAQDAPPAGVDAQAEVQAQLESDQETAGTGHEQHATAATDIEIERDCLRYTGSHITTRALEEQDKDCVTAAGRVYSREDIQRTGQTNIADALRQLDPAVF